MAEVAAKRRGMIRLLPWCGLRGGLALALSLPASAQKSLILNMTCGVAAFSNLVQRSTIGRSSSRRIREG
ncbi:MAG: hypothetical protein OEW98_00355 [Betaproteobacteria bacterium]|nr:hypothetical protein [Betaproteobacteria bacterium]